MLLKRRAPSKGAGEIERAYGEISYVHRDRKEHYYLIEGSSANHHKNIKNHTGVKDFVLHFIDPVADKDSDFSAHYKWVRTTFFDKVSSEDNQGALQLLREESPW